MKKNRSFLYVPVILSCFAMVLFSCGGGNGNQGNQEDEHNWVLKTGTPPTCEEGGISDYYYCNHCNKYQDLYGNVYDDPSFANLPSSGHATHFVEKTGDCISGVEDHYECYNCDAIFDRNQKEATLEELTYKGEHNLSFYQANSPSCYQEGTTEHYYCSSCYKYFKDAEATIELDYYEDIIINATHNFIYHEGTPATCEEYGVKAYYECQDCWSKFEDENGENGIWDTTLYPLGHSYTVPGVLEEASCEKDRVEATYCENEGCDSYVSEVIGNSATGHNFVDGACTTCSKAFFSEGLEYSFNNYDDNPTASVIGIGTCTDEDIVIPSEFQGYTITSINIYYGVDSVKTMTLPETVTEISNLNMPNLKTLNLNEGLIIIDNVGCPSLEAIDFPSTLETIGNGAFVGCASLKEVVIPDTVKSIERQAFEGCTSLESVTWNNTVTTIPNSVFSNCTSLNNFVVPDTVTKIEMYAFNNCESLTNIQFGANLEEIEMYAFYFSNLTEVRLAGGKLKTIGDCAFSNSSKITNLYIDATSLEKIGFQSFYYCDSLKNLYIINGNQVEFDNYAFSNCSSLEAVNLKNENNNVSNWASFSFKSKEANPLYWCDGIIKIYQENVDDYVEVSSLDLTNNGADIIIGDYAFYNANYSFENLSSVVSVGVSSFEGCKQLETIDLRNCYYVGKNAFKNCTSLKSAKIAFTDETKITGSKVSTLAFEGCNNLTEISIGENFETIEQAAFSKVSYLERLEVPFMGGTKKDVGQDYQYPLGYYFSTSSYDNAMEIYQTYVQFGKTDTKRSDIFYIPETLKHVSITKQRVLLRGVFSDVDLESLTLTNNTNLLENFTGGSGSVNSIYYNADLESWFYVNTYNGHLTNNFYYAENGKYKLLTNLVIPENITNIAYASFAGVNSIISLTIPEGVTCTNPSAFKDTNIYEVYDLGNNSLTAGTYQFGEALLSAKVVHTSLDEPSIIYVRTDMTFLCDGNEAILLSVDPDETFIILPTSISHNGVIYTTYTISNRAFINCNQLHDLRIPDGFAYNAKNLLQDCTSMIQLKLPSLQGYTLGEIFGCENEDVPETLEQVLLTNEDVICDYAFNDCNGVRIIKILDGATQIGEYAFAQCDSLREVYIPDSVTSIGSHVVYNCRNLEVLHYSANADIDEDSLQYLSKLVELKVPNMGKTLNSGVGTLSYLFNYTNNNTSPIENLEKLTLSGNIITINQNAFSNFAKLKDLYIEPTSDEFTISIAGGFNNTVLENIYFDGTIDDWFNISFSGTNFNPFYLGKNVYMKDANDEYYLVEEFGDIVVSDVSSIPSYAYSGIKANSLTLLPSENVVEIEKYAFAYCEIKTINLPANAKFMDYYIFTDSIIEELTIPSLAIDGMTATIDDLFDFSMSSVPCYHELKKLTVLTGEEIYLNYFGNFAGLEELYLPGTITGVYSYEQNNWQDGIGESVKAIYFDCNFKTYLETDISYINGPYCSTFVKDENGEYYDLKALDSIIIPADITTMRGESFHYFSNLSYIYIPSTVTINATREFTTMGKDVAIITDLTEDNKWSGVTDVFANTFYFGYEKEQIYEDGNFVYLLKDDNTAVVVKSCKQDAVNLTIPAQISSNDITYNVTVIGNRAFYEMSDLETIVIPDGITSIEYQAFFYTNSLSTINVPASVTYIADHALAKTSAVIYNHSTYRSNYYNYYAGETSITYILDDESVLYTEGDFDYIIELGDSYKYAILAKYHGDDAEVTIPDFVTYEYHNYEVFLMGDGAFMNTESLEVVNFTGNELYQIGKKAFANCPNLKTVSLIPSSVEQIKSYVFENCESLEEVTFATRSTIVTVGTYAFSNVNISYYEIPEFMDVSAIHLFYNSTHPVVVITREENSEYNSVTGGDPMVIIYYNVTDDNLIEKDNVLYYLDTANKTATLVRLLDTSLTTVEIPETIQHNNETYTLTKIGRIAFANSNITSVTTPSTIVEIEAYAFYNCKNLTNVVINDEVEALGYRIFEGCNNVTNLTLPYIGTSLSDTSAALLAMFRLDYGSGERLVLNKLVITKGYNFSTRNCLAGVEATEMHFYADLELFSANAFDGNVYYFDRIYIHTVSTTENSIRLDSRFYGVILYAGEFDTQSQYYENPLYTNYSEDTYATIDGITYKLSGENAKVIHIDRACGNDYVIPETITYKEATYQVEQ